MTCKHFWLPARGTLFCYVFCGHCDARRRVKLALWRHYDTIGEALGDAIDRGVIPSHEVIWKGDRLR